jgi:hypothetical protein
MITSYTGSINNGARLLVPKWVNRYFGYLEREFAEMDGM